MPTLTKEIIEAAIAGFEGQKQIIDGQIAELRALLNGTPVAAAKPEVAKTKREVSAIGLKRMREAQQRRWAKVRGESTTPTGAAPISKPKRKMSAAGRNAIAAAQKKRWATKKASTV